MLFLTFFLAFSESDHVGNGGDPLRILMSRAKQYAAERVRLADTSGSGEKVAWLRRHQYALGHDIKVSPHEWVQEATETCASTSRHPSSVIRFSFPTCRFTQLGMDWAIELLIHESIHHLGIRSEAKADALARTLMSLRQVGQFEERAIDLGIMLPVRGGSDHVFFGQKSQLTRLETWGDYKAVHQFYPHDREGVYRLSKDGAVGFSSFGRADFLGSRGDGVKLVEFGFLGIVKDVSFDENFVFVLRDSRLPVDKKDNLALFDLKTKKFLEEVFLEKEYERVYPFEGKILLVGQSRFDFLELPSKEIKEGMDFESYYWQHEYLPEKQLLVTWQQNDYNSSHFAVWNLRTHEREVFLPMGPKHAIQTLDFDLENQLLAVATGSHIVELWDLAMSVKFKELELPTGNRVEQVVISPKGTRLAVLERPTKVPGRTTVWDLPTRELVHSFLGLHQGMFGHIQFSENGDRLFEDRYQVFRTYHLGAEQ